MPVSPPLNPITLLVEGNGSLAGRDRDGAFTATGSGSVRYAAAPGARVNWFTNPGLASNSTSWSDAGSAVGTRTGDADFQSGQCWSSVATASTSDGFNVVAQMRSVALASASLTVGVSTKLTSGASDWQVCAQLVDAAGSLIGSPGSFVDLVPAAAVGRAVLTITNPAGSGSGVQLQFRRKSAAASTIRAGDVTIESGSTAGSWFTPVWLNPITGQLGTAHASPSVSRAQFWVEEGTTNLVTNPWRATNNTGWAALNGSTARTTAYAFQGPGAGLLTASAANAEEYISITAAASSHTAQAIVRNAASGARQCRLTYNGSLIGSLVSVAAGAMQTITAPFTGTGGAANLGVRWIDSVNTDTFVTYYLGAEAKTYATSPCPAIDAAGSLGTGYSWAGTAHASASTRVFSSVRVPSSVFQIDQSQFEVVGRVQGPVVRGYFVGVIGSGSGTMGFTNSGNNFRIFTGLGSVFTSIPINGSQGYIASAALGGTTLTGFLNGVNGGSATLSGSFTTLGSFYLDIGGANGSPANRPTGPLVIYDARLSDARRALVSAAIDSNGATDLWTLFEEWETVLSPVDLFDLESIEGSAGVAAELAPLDLFALQAGEVSAGVAAELEALDLLEWQGMEARWLAGDVTAHLRVAPILTARLEANYDG